MFWAWPLLAMEKEDAWEYPSPPYLGERSLTTVKRIPVRTLTKTITTQPSTPTIHSKSGPEYYHAFKATMHRGLHIVC